MIIRLSAARGAARIEIGGDSGPWHLEDKAA
jgi:hypothetical protein